MSSCLRCVSLFCIQIFFFTNCIAQNTIPPIGYWREHLNYQNTIQVVRGDKIYCATTNNVFSVDANNEIERYSKVNGLNDLGVNTIGWDDFSKQLVIAYTNSNVDVLQGSIVKNIGDILRSNIIGNKNINRVYCKNGLAYLSTSLGIVVADIQKYEIKDTWIIGANGSQTIIHAFAADAANFYAATDEGLKVSAIANTNQANFSNWQNMSGLNGLSFGAVSNVLINDNKIIVQKNDSLFVFNNNQWSLLYTDSNWPIVNTDVSENKIFVCQRTNAGNSRVIQLNNSGVIEKTLTQSGIISFPKSALLNNNSVWIADFFGGLSSFNNSINQFIPNGPLGASSGEMIFNNNQLYVSAGSVNDAWNYQYNRNGIYFFKNDEWTYKSAFNIPKLDTALDFITVAINPTDGTLWAGSYGGGLVQFTDNDISIFKKGNSTLQAAIGDPSSYRVSGLAFDQNNNLWISNYGAFGNLQVKKPDGTFKSFHVPFQLNENAVSQIVVDDADQLWIISPKGNGLICYNYGNDVNVTNDDQWKYFRSGIGVGNLPSNNVLSIAKDKFGFIWVGTDKGIAIFQCVADIFNQTCDALLPVVKQDRYAGYLFRDEEVRCIAVDGANRKWVGTKNGVWLISPEGDNIIYNFTVDNSPLLDNDIKKITINPETGEVFIATFKGICSFRSTATEASEANTNVLVFPNPVPPNYGGTIAIRGLVDNALVKITELNGRLVYQTNALGGQAIWDGRNYNGQKVASGLYLVLIKDDINGVEKLVTKIVIVNGR